MPSEAVQTKTDRARAGSHSRGDRAWDPPRYREQIDHELRLIDQLGYASCCMKHHHPGVFCAALHNAQPMGFYAPAQIVRGRLQKEGDVIHVICDRIVDHDAMLRSIGRVDFSVLPGRGDSASHGGGPDPRDQNFPHSRTLASPPFGTPSEQEENLRIRSHDFYWNTMDTLKAAGPGRLTYHAQVGPRFRDADARSITSLPSTEDSGPADRGLILP